MILALAFSFLLGISDSTVTIEKQFEGFSNAVSLTVDVKGFIYVLDKDQNQIYKLDSNLKILKRSRGIGWAHGQFDSPTYIDGTSGRDLIVSDPNNNRLQRLDLNLAFISELKTDQPTFLEEFQFRAPVASTVINSSELYIVDGENKRVVIFPRGFEPNNSFGGFNSPKVRLSDPVKILKDGDNFIYILDKSSNSIKVFDNFGTYKKEIKPDKIYSFYNYNGVMYIYDGVDITLYNLSSGAYTESFPSGISLQEDNFTDFLVYNANKYLLLEKNKLSLLIK